MHWERQVVRLHSAKNKENGLMGMKIKVDLYTKVSTTYEPKSQYGDLNIL